ncbi:murein biosynthesis integral membrane protein MurJ, partial [Patescibacteria group bacterium]|nr:murein biosynthesis integral membrane protein MurJ [Patescibacteria group bacterium]
MKLFSLFNFGPIRKFTSAAFVIGALSLISSLLGLIRDRVLASCFGAGDTLDIYYAAFRLPDLVFNILIFGALSSAFVPIFSSQLTKNKKQAFEFAGTALNLVLIIILGVSLISLIFTPWLLKIIVPGFSGEKLKTTVELTRFMFLSPVFLSVSGIFSGVLTTFKKFLTYSLAPVMYNVGIIFGIFFFTPRWGIHGLAFAVIAGALLHMLIQLPGALASGFRFNLNFNFMNESVKKISRLMLPRSLSLLVNQFNLLFITVIASTLMAGSLAVFNLANNLAGIPLTIFGAPFAIAVFPDLAFLYNRNRMKKFTSTFSKAFTRISFFVIPSAVIILVLRAQLVRLILGSGKFDWQDTTLTFQVLGFLALSLFFQSLIPLVSRTFFALHNTVIPFIAGLCAAVINITLAFLLSRSMGVAGIALAFSASQAIYLIIMLVILYVKIGGLRDHEIISSFLKISAASLICGAVIQGTKHLSGHYLGTDTFLKIFIQTSSSSLLGISSFIFSAWYLG